MDFLTFIWISAVMVWFRCVFDLFALHAVVGPGRMGGPAHLRTLGGRTTCLIVRGRSMADRQMAKGPSSGHPG